MQLGVWPVLVGRRNSLTSEFWSLNFLHGLGAAADAPGNAPGGAACLWYSGFRWPRMAREGLLTPRQ